MAKNKIIFNALSGQFDTVTDVSDIENRDDVLALHSYEDNALVYDGASPGVQDPLTNILGQKFSRDGWYFQNSTFGQSIAWYFFDGNPISPTFQASLQKSQFSAYVVMTLDSLGAKPIIGIYSIPTGTGDFLPGFAHSRWSYQISNANLATLTIGKKYLLYVGENPSAHPELDHVPLDYIPAASGGDRLDTELIVTASLVSDGTEPANDVKWMVESLGVWSTSYKQELSLRIRNLTSFDFSQSQELVKEPTGFATRSTSTISFTEGSRQFTIAPTGATFDVYIKGKKYSKASTSITIPNTSGDHYIYFNSAGTLSSTMIINESLFADNALVSIVYWNADVSKAVYFGEERHGLVMDGATHGYLHTVFGARYISGCALQGFTIGAGSVDADAQFSADSGSIRDEDILLQFTSQATIPVLYRSGANWRKKTADAFPFIQSGSAGYVGASGRIAYNQFTGGAWQLTEVPNNYFTLVHVFATNDVNNPYVAIAGTGVYSTKPDAQDSANSEIAALTGIPFAEFVAIGTVILQTANSFTNSVKAAVQVTSDGANYVDFRGAQVFAPSGQASNHSLLSNLDKDDHIQYFNQTRGDARYAQPSYVDSAVAALSASNLGTGSGVFASRVLNDFRFKSLKAGTNITLSSDANEVTINSTGGGDEVSIVVDTFNGDGVETDFTLSIDPVNKENTEVYINGVYQNQATYSVTGTLLEFSEAPPTGTGNIEVKMLSLVAAGSLPDATASVKGVLKLAGDLGGTANLPTVPALASKAPLDSPAFSGTPTAPTPALGTSNTQIATTAFVQQNYLPFTKWNFTATPASTFYEYVTYDSYTEAFYSVSNNSTNPISLIRSIDGQVWENWITTGLTSQSFWKIKRVGGSSLPNGNWFVLGSSGGTTQSLYKYSLSNLVAGGSWSAITTPLSTVYGIDYAYSKYVAVIGTKIYYSTNAATWTAASGLTSSFVYEDVVFAGTRLVAIGKDNSTFNRIMATSTDGVNWTETAIIYFPATSNWHKDLKYFNGVFVSVSNYASASPDKVLYSLDDGATWNYSNISGTYWKSCTYDPITQNYVIIGECRPFLQRRSIAITKDFVNYKYAIGALPSNATAIAYSGCAAGNGRIVAMASGGSGAGALAASMTSDPLSYYEGFL
jgi:hypothetical protein